MARKTTSRKSTSKKPATRASSRKTSRKRSTSLSSQLAKISKTKKKEIFGVFFILLGAIALIGFLGYSDGIITGWLVEMLSLLAGLGAVAFPVMLLLIGFWLIFNNGKRKSLVTGGRLGGIISIYFNVLAWMHWFSGGGWELAESRKGGGYIGAIFEGLLDNALGEWGAFVVLLAWVLISLMLTFDVSIPDLFGKFTKSVSKTGKFIKDQSSRITGHESGRKAAENGERVSFSETSEQPEGFTPLQKKKVILSRKKESGVDKPKSVVKQKTDGLPDGVTIEKVYHAAANKIDWKLPEIDEILNPVSKAIVKDSLDKDRAAIIEETLRSFGAPGHVVQIHRGPTFTQFGIEPDFIQTRKGKMRVRINKITSLANDLALAMAAPSIRIQAPVPGRKYIGIEVPNAESELVTLRVGMQSKAFQKNKSFLRFVLGKDVAGKPKVVSLTDMPHLLIAGTTGSGKSVCINAILSCFLMNRTPNELRLLMVDPKRVELTGYNGIPHLLTPVIVDKDKVVGTLQWMSREMDSRFKKFAEVGARNIEAYNARQPNKLPYIIVVIDELADLMMIAPEDTERHLNRLAQLARATGIHVIIATQRPSTNVITGTIKANFPARISFKVVSGIDSRVVLDHPGAEKLIGFGDMLFQSPDAVAPVRLQGVFVTNDEISKLVNFWERQARSISSKKPKNSEDSVQPELPAATLTQRPLFDKVLHPDEDPYLGKGIAVIREEKRASISMLQRKLKIGYQRAARMIDRLEEMGIIGKADSGSGVRPVLDYGEEGEK